MPSISERKIFNIIGTMYDIAQETSAAPWESVYREMAELFGSGPGGLSAFDSRDKSFSVIESTVDDELIKEYFQHYQHHSPLRQPIADLKVGERLNRQEIIDDSAFRKHQIFNDFYRRGSVFHLEYRVFLNHQGAHAGLSFSRPEGKPNFSENEKAAISYLIPHLARAFRLYFSLLDVHRYNDVISDAFNHIPQGVIILDRLRKPIFMNARATELLENGRDLRLNRSGVVETAANDRQFEKVIAEIFDRNAFPADRFGGVLKIEREGRRPLELMISPFHGVEFRSIGSEKLVIVFITDPDAKTADLTEMLTRLYGLTPTEAKMAQWLAQGLSFAEACDAMSITSNTGRTHLKRIFSKTDTTRQSGLVKLIMSSSANNTRVSKSHNINPFR